MTAFPSKSQQSKKLFAPTCSDWLESLGVWAMLSTACAFMNFWSSDCNQRCVVGTTPRTPDKLRDGDESPKKRSLAKFGIFVEGWVQHEPADAHDTASRKVPLSNAIDEQRRASAALVSRHHTIKPSGTLQAKSTVLTARKLLPAQTKAQRCQSWRPGQEDTSDTWRQVFFRDVCKAAARRSLETLAIARQKLQRKVMKYQVKLLNGLIETVRRRYAVLATVEAACASSVR